MKRHKKRTGCYAYSRNKRLWRVYGNNSRERKSGKKRRKPEQNAPLVQKIPIAPERSAQLGYKTPPPLKIYKTVEMLQFYRNFFAGNAVKWNFKNDCTINSPLREMLPIQNK